MNATPRGKITYFNDKAGEHRWRFTSPNGRVLSDSAEGYKNRADAINGFHVMCSLVGGNPAYALVEFEGSD